MLSNKYRLAGQATPITLEFKIDGQFVVPATNTVYYTVRDNSGLALAGLTDVLAPATSTSIEISVPDTANAKSASNFVERRTVSFRFVSNSITYYGQVSYYLTDWLNFDADENDVRGELGLDPDELPNEQIDMVVAYMRLVEDLSGVDVPTILAGGDLAARFANRAIALYAAIEAVPPLMLGVARELQTDSAAAKRFPVKWDQVLINLNTALSMCLAKIRGTSFTPTYAVTSTRTDPFTGA